VRSVVGLNHAKLALELGPSTDCELWRALQYVVRDLTGTEYAWLEGEDFPLACVIPGGESAKSR
jgi:hypothetical protein